MVTSGPRKSVLVSCLVAFQTEPRPLGSGCWRNRPVPGATTPSRSRLGFVICCVALWQSGCTSENPEVVYDTTAAKPMTPSGTRERLALQRGPDLRLIDRLMDEQTALPPFERRPLPARTSMIADGVALLDDVNPFPDSPPLPDKDVTIRVGLARSTYRTRTRAEVLSAVQPFIDIIQREVNVRGEPILFESGDELYYALLDGKAQMTIAHVFDYMMIRSWFANQPDNAAVMLASARPANPRSGELDRGFEGVRGTSIELIVARDAPYQTFADLRGKRLALAANYVHAPGTFLTHELAALGQPRDERFFSNVTLRRYTKDAVIDVLKGKADVACVDQGTVGALDRFYGLAGRVRTLAVSPRYNVDVLFTSLNNIETHRTEIELTQTQITTLGKDPEGEEVLFFFDIARWVNHRKGDLSVPERHFKDYLSFIDDTPIDLEPLLNPKASVDRQTYDRYGDE